MMCPAKKLTEIKREAIIEAASHEFKSSGFSGTSMDRIAETAEVSKRTIYKHFPSKEILFQTITQELCDRALQVSEYPYDAETSVRDQLYRIGEQEMDFLISDECLDMLRMVTSEFLATPELTRESFDEFQENNIGVVKWIKTATEDGKLKVDNPVTAGKQFIALIEAFALWPQFYGVKPAPGKKQQAEIIDSAVRMFYCHYGVTEG